MRYKFFFILCIILSACVSNKNWHERNIAEVTETIKNHDGDCLFQELPQEADIIQTTSFFKNITSADVSRARGCFLKKDSGSKFLSDVNRAVEIVERCEVSNLSKSQVTENLNAILSSGIQVTTGIGYHMPAEAIKCLGKIYKDSGDCEISRKIRQYVHTQSIYEQLSKAGKENSISVFETINCRDIEHIKYFIDQAANPNFFSYFPYYKLYLTNPDTVKLIRNLKNSSLQKNVDQLCRSGLRKNENFEFLRLINTLQVCP